MCNLRRINAGLAVALLLAGPALAQPVGTIAEICSTATCTNATATKRTAELKAPVLVGDQLSTDSKGQMFVNFDDRSVVKLFQDSELRVASSQSTPQGFRTECSLLEGTVHVYVRKTSRFEVVTPAGVVRSHSTDFVVSYNPATEIAQIIGVEGEVEVSGVGRCEGGRVTVAPRQVTTVERGRCPATPWPVDDAVLNYYVGIGELIGGGDAETLSLDDVATGTDVPPDHRATGHRPSFTGHWPDRGCTTPADCVKPPFVPPGDVIVEF